MGPSQDKLIPWNMERQSIQRDIATGICLPTSEVARAVKMVRSFKWWFLTIAESWMWNRGDSENFLGVWFCVCTLCSLSPMVFPTPVCKLLLLLQGPSKGHLLHEALPDFASKSSLLISPLCYCRNLPLYPRADPTAFTESGCLSHFNVLGTHST